MSGGQESRVFILTTDLFRPKCIFLGKHLNTVPLKFMLIVPHARTHTHTHTHTQRHTHTHTHTAAHARPRVHTGTHTNRGAPELMDARTHTHTCCLLDRATAPLEPGLPLGGRALGRGRRVRLPLLRCTPTPWRRRRRRRWLKSLGWWCCQLLLLHGSYITDTALFSLARSQARTHARTLALTHQVAHTLRTGVDESCVRRRGCSFCSAAASLCSGN